MPYKVIDSWDKVTTQQEAIEFARNHGANIVPEGEKQRRAEVGRNAVHLHDSCRTLGKCEREQIRCWFWQLGLPVLGLAVLLGVAFGVAWLMGVA
jgi:hypothetical protein